MIAGNITIGTQVGINEIQKYLFFKYGPDKARMALYWHDSITIFTTPEIAAVEKEYILRLFTESTFKYSGMKTTYLDIAGQTVDSEGNLYYSDGTKMDTEIREEIKENKEGKKEKIQTKYYFNEFTGDWTKKIEEKHRYSANGDFSRIA